MAVPKPLVYVHGAGPQKPAKELKQELDQILFAGAAPATRVAYYADVRWGPTTLALPSAAGGEPAGDGQAARTDAIAGAANAGVSPQLAASMIVGASVADSEGPGLTLGAPSSTSKRDSQEAQRLVARLYRRADRIASRSSTGVGVDELGFAFPDPIFRFVVGHFASDVVDYLYGPFADAMRLPVRQALLVDGPPPKVIVAHSLGTIVLYDVLSEPACGGLKVDLLVTVGCPLGIGNVQRRIGGRTGPPNPVPGSLAAWSNFADRWDPVALDPTMRDSFEPPRNFAIDTSVNNPAPNNHDLTGYLSVRAVQAAIVQAAVGPD